MDKSKYRFLRQALNFKFQKVYFFKQVALDISILATIAILFQSPYAILNIFILPAFMFRQFSILHEAVHHLSHPGSRLNQFIGLLAGAFCLTPFTAWKTAHLKHHYWTGNLEQDPTFSILKYFNQSSSLKKYLLETTWRKGVPYLAALQHFNFWLAEFKNIRSIKNVLSLSVPLIGYLILVATLSFFNLAICGVGIALYFRMYEEMIVPQHVGLYSDDDVNHHSPAWDQPLITRSWSMPTIIEKYVALNMNYHTEHHLFPDLPWHQLEKAHKLLLQEKEIVHVIDFEWMKNQRNRAFSEVIVPVPSRKKAAA